MVGRKIWENNRLASWKKDRKRVKIEVFKPNGKGNLYPEIKNLVALKSSLISYFFKRSLVVLLK
jgi:hypothetical protein